MKRIIFLTIACVLGTNAAFAQKAEWLWWGAKNPVPVSAANPLPVTVTSGGTGINQLTSDVTAGPGTGSQAATIANKAVTYAKIQDVAASKLLGNPTGSAAAPSEITLGTNLSFTGSVLNASGGGFATAGCGLASASTTVSASGRTAHGNSDYTILSTDNYVGLNAALSAPRAWTLPAANALTAGCTVKIADEAGGITSTNTLTITPAGSDTINGGIGYPLNGAYMAAYATTDGTSAWTVTSALNIPLGTLNTLPRWSATTLVGSAISDNGTSVTVTGEGLVLGAPTGGGQGAGTVNASHLYKDGVEVNGAGSGVLGGQSPYSLPDADASIPAGHYLITLGSPIIPITARRTYTLPQASAFGTGQMVVSDSNWALGGGAVDAEALFQAFSGDTLLTLADNDNSHNVEIFQPGSSFVLNSNGVDTWNVVAVYGPQRFRYDPVASGGRSLTLADSGVTVFSSNVDLLQLPGPLASVALDNTEYTFVVLPGGTLTIKADAADKITDGATLSVAGGTMVSSTAYSTVTIKTGVTSGSPGVWFVTAKTGTWVVT